MANQITGRVKEVRPTQTLTSKSGKAFTKREIILDCTRYDAFTGERGYENTPILTFTGDRCALLDGYQPGEIVTVDFDLQGQEYTRQDGNRGVMNDVRGFRIARRQAAQPQPAAQPAPQQQPWGMTAAPVHPQPGPGQRPWGNDSMPF
ncbi:MAG: DUF3127 domain-containing protein [Pseudoflavonifractor sp.]|nr:DUF3127 domain-containing protein [Alloprevotella sp.]MCM1117624.1 DUF3127 domain-containing protein [Pseudoflavonifractor sp.]